jgi:hypothetical protein
MLIPYDQFIQTYSYQNFEDAVSFYECKYYGSDLMEALEYRDMELFEQLIIKAIQVCHQFQIPVHHHFRTIFKCGKEGLYKDIKLSRLACYFITINADPAYPAVAEAQLFISKLVMK